MLLVQFTCIEPKLDLSTLDQSAYVDNVFSRLCADGYIDAVVVDCSSSRIEQDAIQEFDQGIFGSNHVHEEKERAEDSYSITSSDVFTIQYVWEV